MNLLSPEVKHRGVKEFRQFHDKSEDKETLVVYKGPFFTGLYDSREETRKKDGT